MTEYSTSNVGYWITKYQLNNLSQHKVNVEYKDKYYFNKIDTREKAYVTGFILGDGYISKNKLEITVALRDVEILEFIQSELGANIHIDRRFNKKQKKFPNASLSYYNNTLIKHLIKQVGGTYKEDRRFPRINPKLEKYLLQGFFDADGCITWGRRKDRNRIWQKIQFTSQLKMLEGVQNILYNQLEIPSKIRPKSNNEKCFVLEFAKKNTVLDFLDYIYQEDFVILKRKYQNANKLRLELGELGKS